MPGARAALLLDATGELVMRSGAPDERHGLVGAYQGIALTRAHRAAHRAGIGKVRLIVSRYEQGHVLSQPLKDGYFLVLLLAPKASPSLGRHFLGPVETQMNQAL